LCPLIFNQTIPVCQGKEDCQVKWDAAQFWIVKNLKMKLQTTTNVVIQTYSSPRNSLELAARVTKEPMGSGKYKILIHTWCDNFICTPRKNSAMIDFNNYVNSFKL
jgi:hypothetical protein